jgi:predicted alpha/beta superfamily hydrolase
MKSNVLLFLLLTSFIFNTLNAQISNKDNIVGTSFLIQSEVLNEEREIQIYLPENYSNTSTKYPVLYVIDGQRYFLNGITFQQNLTWENLIPEFIVVGIVTDSRKRRTLFYKESLKFIQFLELELIPFIDKEYRTLDDRIYFGWEMAAGLGVEIMAHSPSLFNGYLLSSPTHISANRLDNVKKILDNNPTHNLFLYASLGTVENWAVESMTSLDSLFKHHSSKNIQWNYNLSENENHYTTPLVTFNEGLRKYYSDYGPLRFYTLKQFDDFGGIKELKRHYINRGSKYQITTDIHLDTKHYLLWQSVKEGNFSLFEQLVHDLDGKEFIENYYNQARWFNSYATFYQVNNKLDKVIEILKIGLKKFPDASILHNGMGDYYKARGEVDKAREAYNKAISIAKNNGESELTDYIKKLESL